MANSSRALVELVLLGPPNARRQLQDSPILGDVWIAFADRPTEPMDLLITPYKTQPAGPLAVRIAKRIQEVGLPHPRGQEAQVAYLQRLVAARLFFREVLRIVVPMTHWWRIRKTRRELEKYEPETLRRKIGAIIDWVQAPDEGSRTGLAEGFADFTALDRYLSLAGIILWAGMQPLKDESSSRDIGSLISTRESPDAIAEELQALFKEIREEEGQLPLEAQIWQISLNRRALPALEKSVPAVKGDAARTLFKVSCKEISWAVLDSGIDGAHDVFRDGKGGSRIVRAYDFSNIRQIISLDYLNMTESDLKARLGMLLTNQKQGLSEASAADLLRKLAEDADNDRPINWELVEKLIEINPADPNSRPPSEHGTHVAGIIAASGSCGKQAGDSARDARGESGGESGYADGMCPDIRLYDFRVLAKTVDDTEFAIIAALQYIRYLNERHGYLSIHGANLSLSIPHDVRNYACGRTPVCEECDRLVESGVVVVAAAGNLGYQRFETREGSYEGYAAFSITDPGNADGVITVGATHRFQPHTYGVSFFSSRGPTGDGRLKPDLVAPGERIRSCLPGQGWGELDGTSMAAPHVSGAAAMLMARYAELIGEPQRIKKILCESATDLGRERSFQGHGMLDVLRAFQKV